MSWKLLGQKMILVPFASSEKFVTQRNQNGGIPRVITSVRNGFEVSEFNGAPWSPVHAVWHPRPVWVLEMFPKDSLYNYGRQILYVDRIAYVSYFKEIYDRAGEYWKTVLSAYRYQALPNGKDLIGSDVNFMASIDDRTHHATVINSIKGELDLPINRLGPEFFTTNKMLQLSK